MSGNRWGSFAHLVARPFEAFLDDEIIRYIDGAQVLVNRILDDHNTRGQARPPM